MSDELPILPSDEVHSKLGAMITRFAFLVVTVPMSMPMEMSSRAWDAL